MTLMSSGKGTSSSALGASLNPLAGRARLAPGPRGAGDRGTSAAELTCGRVNQVHPNARDAVRLMI
jgi:hypothetical protein